MIPSSAQDRPNFTGKWRLDRSRTQLQIEMPDDTFFEIDHEGLRLHVRRTHVHGGSADTVDLEFTTDGEERESEVKGMRILTRVYWDGGQLVADMKVPSPDGEASNFVQYSLKDDGETLVAVERRRSTSVNYDNLWVFINE